MILGTAAYMSPEQARGKAVDERTDIWAFGCVLWEMLTGRAAFAGDTVSDTIAAILDRKPDWRLLPSGTPAKPRAAAAAVSRERSGAPPARYRDVRIEIDEALEACAEPGRRASRRSDGRSKRAHGLCASREASAFAAASRREGRTLRRWKAVEPFSLCSLIVGGGFLALRSMSAEQKRPHLHAD